MDRRADVRCAYKKHLSLIMTSCAAAQLYANHTLSEKRCKHSKRSSVSKTRFTLINLHHVYSRLGSDNSDKIRLGALHNQGTLKSPHTPLFFANPHIPLEPFATSSHLTLLLPSSITDLTTDNCIMSIKSHPRHPPVVMKSVTEQIGNTPLVLLNKVPQSLGLKPTIYAKLEFFNAGGSVKDRIALRMIEAAEASGRIHPDRTTLIEPTSGNTGIGLALVGAIKGYKTIITLPEKMSPEKVAVLKALGAEIIRTPTQAAYDSPESHIGVARRLEKEIPGAVILDQYTNPDNPLAHELGTAEEIWTQTEGKITALVAGAGTGGTITGLARGLRKHKKDIKIIAADPQGSILALPATLNDEFKDKPYKVEGIGYDFIPDVLDQKGVDTWYKTDDRVSFELSRRLIKEEGLLVGGSSGSAMAACVRACNDLNLTSDDVVVVILPDSIRSYLSKVSLLPHSLCIRH